MVIKVSKKNIDKWTSPDFIKYFGSRFYNNYQKYYPVNHAKEGMVFKRIVSKFRKNGKSKENVLRFIDWSFERYLKDPKFTEELTIGFLSLWVDDYLNIIPSEKKRRPEPEIPADMQDWLTKKRKEYRRSYVDPD